MSRFRQTWPTLAIVGLLALFFSTMPAEAAFKLRISDGTTSHVIEDVDGDGFLNWNGSIGNFQIVVTTGISKPAIGDPSLADMDVTSLAVTAFQSTGGTLTIDMTDTEFAIIPGNNNVAHLASSIGGNISTGGSVSFQSWVDVANREFAGIDVNDSSVTSTGLQGPLTGNAFNADASVAFNLTSPSAFSMTSRTVINLSAGGTFSSTDGRTSVLTPAPPAWALAAAALPIVGLGCFATWRRRRTSLTAPAI